jgi:hypothetical protein
LLFRDLSEPTQFVVVERCVKLWPRDIKRLPNHKFRIDRGAANLTVKWSQLIVEVSKRSRDKDVHPSQQVVLWNHLVELELIKQLP